MERNENDVRILNRIIAEQNRRGASLPEELDSIRFKWNCMCRWNEDGKLSELTLMNLHLSGDLDLSGLDALKKINCSGNELEFLNVRKCPALEHLNCDRNQLTSLDVGGNPALKFLLCSGCRLTNLDISLNPALEYLECQHNQIKSLNVGYHPKLGNMDCSDNQLVQLDVGRCRELEYLQCQNNRLKLLDITHNPNLKMPFFGCDKTVNIQQEEAGYEM